MIVGRSLFRENAQLQIAGKLDILSRLINILKHSASLDLLITNRFKVMFLSLPLAITFLAFLVTISNRLLFERGLASGFSFSVFFLV